MDELQRQLEATDVAWAAGFFEGDGTITMRLGSHSFTGQIMASQKERGPLDRLQKLFGGKVTRRRQSASSLKPGNPLHHWFLSAYRAKAFLQQIHPYVTSGGKMKRDIEDYIAMFSTKDRALRLRTLARFRLRRKK